MEKRLRILGLLGLIETQGLDSVADIHDLEEIPAEYVQIANSIYGMGLMADQMGDHSFCSLETKEYDDFKRSLIPKSRVLGPQHERVINDVVLTEALIDLGKRREDKNKYDAGSLFGDYSIKA